MNRDSELSTVKSGASLWSSWVRSNRIVGISLAAAAAVAFFTTWFLMSPLVERVDRSVLMGMVVGNVVIAAGFAALVGARLWVVLKERRHQLAGSQTHVRFVWLFSILAVVPAVIAFLFAFTILRTSLNDVFSERIVQYQTTARDIANTLVDFKAAESQQRMMLVAADINRQEETGLGFEQTPISFRRYVRAQAQVRGMSALYLIDGDGRILVSAEVEAGRYNLPAADRLSDFGDSTTAANSFLFGVNDDAKFDIFRSVISTPHYGGGYIVGYERIDPETTNRLFAVAAIRDDWAEAQLGRSRLERVFFAGYIVLATIILFGAIWIAIIAASRLVQPISRLVDMSERVSAGDLAARVEVFRDDGELGALARSLNHMTAQLQSQRDDVIDTNRQLDNRRRFTEAVLSGVPAGVIGFDGTGRITIANRSAAELAGIDSARLTGENIDKHFPELASLRKRAAESPFPEVGDQVEHHRQGVAKILNVRIVSDEGADDERYVATFDDITQLISAQRNAAWGDVARRIAHEIKNPLTPIQLSAERLRKKYLNEVVSSPEVFDQCTDTIIRHVSDIGRMVDEFSSFARMPKPVIGEEDVIELVKSAVFPQRVAFADINFSVEAPDAPVTVVCDDRLIVQALTNLLKNAGESVTARLNENNDGSDGKVLVRIEVTEQFARIHVIDNGVGLPAEQRHRLAEPYMTTRAKGTGLGLAIVKKVSEEHEGGIEFADDQELGRTGARVTIFIPLSHTVDDTSSSSVAAAE